MGDLQIKHRHRVSGNIVNLAIKLLAVLPRQLGDIRRKPTRLVFGEQLGRHSPLWLFLIINIRELLPFAVLHQEDVMAYFRFWGQKRDEARTEKAQRPLGAGLLGVV